MTFSGDKFERNSNGVYVDGWTYGTLKVIGNEIKSGVNGIKYNYGVGYLEVVNNVIRDNSGWGMYLYGVSGGGARGNLVSGNGSGVYIPQPLLSLITLLTTSRYPAP